MTKPDRTSARARKAFAHAVLCAMDARESQRSARTVATAERRSRAARRRYLEELRNEAHDSMAWEA